MAYSAFISMWSVLFIARWKQRESELMFIWGTGYFTMNQEPVRVHIRLADRLDAG
jgi:hypothetical protein